MLREECFITPSDSDLIHEDRPSIDCKIVHVKDAYNSTYEIVVAQCLRAVGSCADERRRSRVSNRYSSILLSCIFVVGTALSLWLSRSSEMYRLGVAERAAISAACPAFTQSLGTSGTKSALAAAVEEATEAFAFDPHLVYAVMASESNCREQVRSRRGAVGPMQLMPATATWLGVNPHNVRENIRGGTKYLSILLKQFDGDLELALAAYNAGPAKVRRYAGIPPYAETRQYVERVLRYYNELRSIAGNKTALLEQV